MSELEKAALNYARYNEEVKRYTKVLDSTQISDWGLVEKRKGHLDALQNEVDEAYQIMLKYLAEQKTQTDQVLTEMVRMSEELGLYD